MHPLKTSAIFLALLLASSCAQKLTDWEWLQYYEMKDGLNFKTDFKLKKKYMPFYQASDYGIPAHTIMLWISTKPMNVTNLTKKQFVDFIGKPYTVVNNVPKHFRLPSKWEADAFKMRYPQILTQEKLEAMADSDTITNPIYLVRSGLGKSSSVEF